MAASWSMPSPRDVTDPQTGVQRRAKRLRAKVLADRLCQAFDGADATIMRAVTVTAAEAGERHADRRAWVRGRTYSAYAPASRRCRRSTSAMAARGSQGGAYHSIYDSYDHFTRFEDPGPRLWRGAFEDRRPDGAAHRRCAETPPVRFGDLAATTREILSRTRCRNSERNPAQAGRQAHRPDGHRGRSSSPPIRWRRWQPPAAETADPGDRTGGARKRRRQSWRPAPRPIDAALCGEGCATLAPGVRASSSTRRCAISTSCSC